MKKYRVLSALLVVAALCSLLCLPVSATETDLQLQCTNAILMDGITGDVLYEQAAYDPAYPASMTKVMTALLTLEAIESGAVTEETLVTVSEYASYKDFADESTANLLPGEQMSVKDLLYCLMLPSANDAAKALAEHLGGTCEQFAQQMNTRAEELGCKNTHFVNPNGLHDPDHYTTAYDIALMFMECMNYDLFMRIIATPDYTTAATNLSAERYFYNTNGLISQLYYSEHVYDKCIGGKTGSTAEAGKCLVAAARDGDKRMISVVMGAGTITLEDGTTRLGQFDESARLLEYGLMNFRRVTLAQTDTVVATVAVTMSEDGTEVGVKPQGTITLTVPNDFTPKDVRSEISLFDYTVEAPVAEGQVMGSTTLYYGDRELGQLELVAERSLEYSKKLYRQQKRQAFWDKHGGWIITVLILIPALPIAALLTLRFINVRRRKRRKKRAAQRRASQQSRKPRQ